MEKTNQIACTTQNIALFNEMHGNPNSLANSLMPQLSGVQLEQGACIFDELAAVDQEHGETTFRKSGSCSQLGRCAISGN